MDQKRVPMEMTRRCRESIAYAENEVIKTKSCSIEQCAAMLKENKILR
jgi:hypothetical protein